MKKIKEGAEWEGRENNLTRMNQHGIPLGSRCMMVMFWKVLTSAIIQQNKAEETKNTKQKPISCISPKIKLNMLKGIRK